MIVATIYNLLRRAVRFVRRLLGFEKPEQVKSVAPVDPGEKAHVAIDIPDIAAKEAALLVSALPTTPVSDAVVQAPLPEPALLATDLLRQVDVADPATLRRESAFVPATTHEIARALGLRKGTPAPDVHSGRTAAGRHGGAALASLGTEAHQQRCERAAEWARRSAGRLAKELGSPAVVEDGHRVAYLRNPAPWASKVVRWARFSDQWEVFDPQVPATRRIEQWSPVQAYVAMRERGMVGARTGAYSFKLQQFRRD